MVLALMILIFKARDGLQTQLCIIFLLIWVFRIELNFDFFGEWEVKVQSLVTFELQIYVL